MRKFTKFVLTFSASLMLGVAVIIAIILTTGVGRDIVGSIMNSRKTTDNQTGERLSVENEGEAKAENTDVTEGLSVLVIFFEPSTNELYLSDCEVSSVDWQLTAVPLELGEDMSETVKSLLSNGDVFSAVDCIKTHFSKNLQNFIKFDGESFRKIADRMNGVVYNENDYEVLLTGIQVLKRMDSLVLSQSLMQFYDTVSHRNVLNELLYIVNNTENNFSYPMLYDLLF